MSEDTKRHETIHFQQMLETFLIGFIILYYWDYARGYFKYCKDGKAAYYSIRAEQEAHKNDRFPNYLSERKRWRWIWDYKV